MSIFVVDNTQTDVVVLVEAVSAAQALRHITKKAYTVKVAKAADVAHYMMQGAKLERAAADEEAHGAAVRG